MAKAKSKRQPAKGSAKRPAKKSAKRPAKQSARRPAKKPAAKDPARTYPTLELYLDNVAANVKLGLERALDTCVSMFQYEMHDEYAELKREAQRALEANAVGDVLALAHARRIDDLDAAKADAMLRDITGAGEARFEGAEE